jgi:hypothetical protein
VTEAENTTTPARVLRALAHGIDPVTGEILGDDGPLQSPMVIRALYEGAEALERQKSAETRKQRPAAPSNAGAPWTPTEDDSLRQSFHKGIVVKQLAVEHQRTEGAISSRLVRLGLIPATIVEPKT